MFWILFWVLGSGDSFLLYETSISVTCWVWRVNKAAKVFEISEKKKQTILKTHIKMFERPGDLFLPSLYKWTVSPQGWIRHLNTNLFGAERCLILLQVNKSTSFQTLKTLWRTPKANKLTDAALPVRRKCSIPASVSVVSWTKQEQTLNRYVAKTNGFLPI